MSSVSDIDRLVGGKVLDEKYVEDREGALT